jgi:proteasome beta subunit
VDSQFGREPGASTAFSYPIKSSFTDVLKAYAPHLLPGAADSAFSAPRNDKIEFEHGTTIVAATFADGVVMAGDRRATSGNMISKRDVRKIFRADEYSAVGAAGAWSFAVAMMRLFQVELEHYEKMEGRELSLLGKANRLGTMIKGNLGAAMQGLAVIPLFVGYDQGTRTAHIYSYDVAGGPFEEQQYHSIGSGSIFAKSSLKKLYTEGMPVQDAVLACVQALYDAADDDSATGGPDLARQIFPVVATVTANGFAWISDEECAEYGRAVVEQRLNSPDGPRAPMTRSQ